MAHKILLAFAVAASLVLFGPAAHASSLLGCPGCSDAFYSQNPITGVFTPQPGTVSTELATDADSPGATFVGSSGFFENLAMIFTEPGAGTSSTALVSDIVYSPDTIFLGYLSDGGTTCGGGFQDFCINLGPTSDVNISHVATAEAFFSLLFPNMSFQVLEETGSPQSMTPFNAELTELFFASDVDPSVVPLPAALPLFATGLGGLGLLGWRRKRKAQAGA